jgi:hypothetical protein
MIRVKEGNPMKTSLVVASLLAAFVFSPTLVFAQAFGEYGKILGGVPHGKGVTGSGISGGGSPGGTGKNTTGGVSHLSGRAVPPRLVVGAKDAALYSRQDDEAEKIAELSQGEILVPMIQTSGQVDWYMVKTEKGLTGWVRSADVRNAKVPESH